MVDIAVAYPSLNSIGGAQAVCLAILDALRHDYDVELITTGEPDTATLSRKLFDSSFEVPYRRLDVGWNLSRGAVNVVARLTGSNLRLLKKSLFLRNVQSIADNYDLLVSARDDVSLGQPALQYIHVPRYALYTANRQISHPEKDVSQTSRRLYHSLCARVARHDQSAMENDMLLANSNWTRDLTKRLYGRDVDVRTVYPPVTVSAFDPKPWVERENGFVTIGRVTPTKQVHRSIEIVSGLRERGYDVHIHVVGPLPDSAYTDRVRDIASRESFVQLDGPVDRETLVNRLSSHKYGIHAKENEPFGMSVVEMVAAGMIPLVPSDSGPAEIINSDDRLIYESIEEAVDCAGKLLTQSDRQREVREKLPNVEQRYGIDQFQQSVQMAVEELI